MVTVMTSPRTIHALRASEKHRLALSLVKDVGEYASRRVDAVVLLPDDMKDHVTLMITEMEKNKAAFSFLISAIAFKIIDPLQNILKIRTVTPQGAKVRGGYSIRTADVAIGNTYSAYHNLPFQMRSGSGGLTRSLMTSKSYGTDPSIFNMRDKRVAVSYLAILNYIQSPTTPKKVRRLILLALLRGAFKLAESRKTKLDNIHANSLLLRKGSNLYMAFCRDLTARFSLVTGASFMPVLMVQAMEQVLLASNDELTVQELRSHFSSDTTDGDTGDVCVLDMNNVTHSAAEIKYNKPINAQMIKIALRKNVAASYVSVVTTHKDYLGNPKLSTTEGQLVFTGHLVDYLGMRLQNATATQQNSMVQSLSMLVQHADIPVKILDIFKEQLELAI